mgnify:CR=1 FL=1
MPRPLLLLAISIVAAIVAWVGTSLMRRIALRFNIADHPNERRINTRPVPRAGGLSIAVTFAVIGAAIVVLAPILHLPAGNGSARLKDAGVEALLLGTLIAGVIGFVDDRYDLRARWQIIGQLLISLIPIAFGLRILFVSNPFGSGVLLFPDAVALGVTIFWTLGMQNSMNFIDGLDGPAARKLMVREVIPRFDGATLDNVVDYFTYVVVPAVFMVQFELLPASLAVLGAAYILATSLYTFANLDLKTSDNYFVGFPALWNVVVLYFFVLQTGWVVNLVAVSALCVLTFIPVKFVHPLRVTDWREITIPMTVLWAAMSLSLVLSAKNRDDWGHIERIELWAWIIASVYFATISLWRTFLKRAEDEPAPDASQT